MPGPAAPLDALSFAIHPPRWVVFWHLSTNILRSQYEYETIKALIKELPPAELQLPEGQTTGGASYMAKSIMDHDSDRAGVSLSGAPAIT